jgi:malonate transporter
MLSVLHVTLPVFALVLCGWIAARRRILSPEAASGINAFVFMFALPAMMYRAASTQSPGQLADLRFLAAFAIAALLMLFGSRWLAPKAAAPNPQQRTGVAFAATHGNVGYMGLPLTAQLGDPSLMPAMVMALLVDILMVIVITILLFEWGRQARASVQGASGPGSSGQAAAGQVVAGQGSQATNPVSGPSDSTGARVRQALIGLLRTPMILGLVVGVVVSAGWIPVPDTAESFIGLLAQAAGPCALFAIGASLGERKIELDAPTGGLVALKLLIHPLLVAALMWILQVDWRLAAVGIMAAGLPTASNVFILSQRYGVNVRPIGAALALGTLLAAASVSFILWMTGLVPA